MWILSPPCQTRLLRFANSHYSHPRLRILVPPEESLFICPFTVMDTSCKLSHRWAFPNRHRIIAFTFLVRTRLEISSLSCLDQFHCAPASCWFLDFQILGFFSARYETECFRSILGDSKLKRCLTGDIGPECSSHMLSNLTSMFTNASRQPEYFSGVYI